MDMQNPNDSGIIFVGQNSSEPGEYFLFITINKRENIFKKGVVVFTPTLEFPDVFQYVAGQYAKNGLRVEKIEIVPR